MQMPKFTKIATEGHPAYRFEHNGQTYEANRFASGAGAWNVDLIEGKQRTAVVRGQDTRAAAVAAVIETPKNEQSSRLDELAADLKRQNADADELLADFRALGAEIDELATEVAEWGAKVDALTEPAPSAEPAEFYVQIERHIQARPRVFQDRYTIFQRGLADPIERFFLPYRGDRNSRTTLEVHGWKLIGDLEYIAGPNWEHGRIEKTPVAYGNAGHWASACVVDPNAGVPVAAGYVAFGRCGAPLVETTATPRGHVLCVGCTGDPVEVALRDRIGWLTDGGRPVKVLRALDHGDRILLETVTTDDAPRDWPVVAPDEVLLAPERPAAHEEIKPGALVEAVIASTHPRRIEVRVDRQPWTINRRSTTVSNERGVDAVYTESLRIVEQPEPPAVNVIDRVDAVVRAAAGVTGPGESPTAPAPNAKCPHGRTLRPGATLLIPCEFGHSYGVFGDEGPLVALDCAVEAANDALDYSAEDDGATQYVVKIVCPGHEEQAADTCEECFAEPDEG